MTDIIVRPKVLNFHEGSNHFWEKSGVNREIRHFEQNNMPFVTMSG